LALTLTAIIIVSAIAAGILFNETDAENEEEQERQKETANNHYIYPLSPYNGNGKIYTVIVETNWTSQPGVSLPQFDTLKYVSVDFAGWSTDNVFFNVTIPTDLLWGNISLVRKYYEQSPDLYTLSNNGTHNSIAMTCVFTPYFSGVGHFEIHGTQGAW
jgi:hypothetical protein